CIGVLPALNGNVEWAVGRGFPGLIDLSEGPRPFVQLVQIGLVVENVVRYGFSEQRLARAEIKVGVGEVGNLRFGIGPYAELDVVEHIQIRKPCTLDGRQGWYRPRLHALFQAVAMNIQRIEITKASMRENGKSHAWMGLLDFGYGRTASRVCEVALSEQ